MADGVKRRRALVAGGASGIGAATAGRLAAMGARVLIADIDAAAGERRAREIGAEFVRVDLTDYDAVSVALAAREPVEILVNSAGVDQHAFFTRT